MPVCKHAFHVQHDTVMKVLVSAANVSLEHALLHTKLAFEQLTSCTQVAMTFRTEPLMNISTELQRHCGFHLSRRA